MSVKSPCGAKARSAGGRPCRQPIVPGGTRCHYHGGAAQRLPRGDPRRGGRPPTTRINVKLPEHLKGLPESARKGFREANPDSLTREIQTAEALLRWAEEMFAKNPTGGLVVHAKPSRDGQPGAVQITPYSELVSMHLERISLLKARKAKLDAYVAARDEAEALAAIARDWAPDRPLTLTDLLLGSMKEESKEESADKPKDDPKDPNRESEI